ncbi:MAG: hypothetical protein RLZZ609_742 [Cyanobacteriota bacterium]|jgi:uncharacterized protein with HEPN domain
MCTHETLDFEAPVRCHLGDRSDRTFSHGKSFEDYAASEMATAAVERKLEIISEALKRAVAEDPSIQQTITVLASVIGLRNRIAHVYDQIDQEILWTTIELWLPRLKSQAKDLLDQDQLPDQQDA